MPCKYDYYSLVFALLLSAAGRGQQRDTLVIHFDFNKAIIGAADGARIDSAVAACNVRGVIRYMEISGHCDNTGNDACNDSLSLERARSARAYCLSRGLPDSIFRDMKHYGSHRPLNDNGNGEKRQQNRRVEIVFGTEPVTRKAVEEPLPPADSPGSGNVPQERPFPTLAEAFSDTAALAGRNIVLHNMNFYGDRHVPLPESRYVLEQLLTIMKQHPGLRIEIQGHICCYKDMKDGYDADTRTFDLSVQRAKFVYTWLLDGGINASRMSYRGFGSTQKLYPEEKNEREKTLNRRVEIKIL